MGRPRIYTEEEAKERKKERQKRIYKEYYALNKEKYAKNAKEYRHTEKGKAALERARKKERDNLSDNYIVQLLACNLYNNGKHSLDRKSVPKEVIEMSRQTILAKRQFKLLNN
jgi:DNA-binding PadR family transcriptional regulator